MPLRVKKIQFGTFKGGKFHARKKNPKMPKLGSGKRFERCVQEEMSKGTAYDPKAVCAARGIRKYGKKRMLKLARKGKARHRHNPVVYSVYEVNHDYSPPKVKVVAKGLTYYKAQDTMARRKHLHPGRAYRISEGTWKEENRSARARNKRKRPRTSRKAPNYKKKKNRRSR